MVDAATSFIKAGYSEEDSAELARVASMLQNVADEEIAAGEAADFLVSQLIAFNKTAEESEYIVDAINEVSNDFAVSSGDLSKALGIVASTSAAMGNSMEETLGIVTAITEQTRNANRSARAANTIFNNLAQVLDDASSNGAKISEIFETLGVSMYDSNGQIKSSYELLSSLAGVWETLDTNYQLYIASTIAGTNQLNNFLALMNNFEHAISATETAYNSAGSAAQENARYMESLQAKLTEVQASFQELANNVIGSELVANILDLVNGFLELMNSGIGPTIVQLGILAGVLTGGITLFGQFGSAVVGSISTFTNLVKIFATATSGAGMLNAAASALGVSITGMGTAAAGASVGFAALSAAAGGIGLAIAAIVGIVTAVRAAFDALIVTYEEATEKVQELNAEIESLSGAGSEYEELANKAGLLTEEQEKQLELLKQQKAELESMPETDTNESSIASLDEQIASLEKIRTNGTELTDIEQRRLNYLKAQLVILEEQRREAQEQQYEAYVSERGAYGKTGAGYMGENAGKAALELGEVRSEVEKLNEQYQNGEISLEKYRSGLADVAEESDEVYQMFSDLAEIYEETGGEIGELNEYDQELYEILNLIFEVLGAGEEYLEDFAEGTYEAGDAARDAAEAAEEERKRLEALAATTESAYGDYSSFTEMMNAYATGAEGATASTDELSTSLSNLQSEYDLINQALQEYNDSGQITLETLFSLLETDGAYYDALVVQNGQLSLNSEWLKNRGQNLVELAKQELTEQVAVQLHSIAMQDLGYSIEETGGKADTEKTSMANFANVLTQVASGALTSGAAMNYLWSSLEPEGNGYRTFSDEAKQAMDDAMAIYTEWYNQLENYQFHWASGVEGGTSGATSANNSYNDSLKETNDLLKERQSLLDEELSILEYQIFLMEKNGASAQDIIAVYEQAQQKVHEAANYYREQGLEETSEYIRDAQQLWWGYEDDIEDVMQSIADAQKEAFDEARAYQEHLLNMNIITEEQYYSQLDEDMRNYWSLGVISAEEYWDYLEDKYDWQMSQLEEAADAMKQAYDDLVADTEDKLNAVMDYVSDYADEQIDALQSQYDALQDEIDAVNDKYDEQLDALKEENDELNKQIERERLLEALAKARSQRLYVYKEGEGFQYVEDIDAIAEAQEALDEFDREQAYEDMLEEQEAFIEQNRQNELEYLEDEQAALEAEIERWEQYKEGWADVVDNYQKNQNALIAQQVLGTNLENANWDTRLNLLDNFVGMYTEFQDTLLATQENTTQYEAWNWEERLANLRDFYQQYVDLLQQIQDASGALQPGDVSSGGDYWYGDIDADYSELMLQAKSLEEFQYWAQQRLLKAQAAGYDIEAMGWRTNEELYNEWLASMGGYAPSNPNWSAPTTGNEDYYPLYGSQDNPNVSSDTSWDANTDYALKMLAAATKEEFDYWAAKRIAKANAMGIDIFTGNEWQTNEELYRQWLQTHGSSAAYSRSGVSVLSSSGYDSSQSAARNLVSTSGYSGGSNSTSYSFSIDNLSLPNATDANSLVSGLRNMAYQYSAQRA